MSGSAVIGLGNPLMGDDGFGLVALARLRDDWTLEGVELADGGTWGMSLLPLIEDSDRLVLLDAIAAGATPGAVVVLERDRLPIYLKRKLSPHQVDLSDVLAVAEWRGKLPAETVAIGVEPESVQMGLELSPAVDRAVDTAVGVVIARLMQWGHRCSPREPAASCMR
ncbi:MAG: HyaD/HybD family hydrogenase maturation endopeptidase [Gemmatimonadaceae bacterium]